MVHYLRMKKRKHVNDDLLEILQPCPDEQPQELEVANVEQNLHVVVEDDKKWIIPDDGKKWVLATINGSWRRYKMIIKQKFYKPYDNDKERLLNRPKGILEEQFKGYIEKVGSKQYKAEMEQMQAQQSENCSTNDPFNVVMSKEHTSRVRLMGKGVTKSDLKASSTSTSTLVDGINVKVPVELVQSITARVKDELTQEILSTVLINLQRVIPNLDSESIMAGFAAGIISPGDAAYPSGCFPMGPEVASEIAMSSATSFKGES
ncbi:hypothetical protein KSP39_PZI000606 [Platanthera zijinensis]|uniref:Uncharacterized protein n=1 Tax=Platanthera zijinensis TaxID=2320716 RepID=A0AAP0GGS8_9ASPA